MTFKEGTIHADFEGLDQNDQPWDQPLAADVRAACVAITNLREEINQRVAQIEELADKHQLTVYLDVGGVSRNPLKPDGSDDADDYYMRNGEWAGSSSRC